MAKCRWCEKTLPGDAIPACGSCLFYSRQEADPANDIEETTIVDSSVTEEQLAKYDLSYLANNREKAYSKGRTAGEVKYALATQTLFGQLETPEIPMKKVKVKSNSIRDRQVVIDGVVLSFDEKGFAEINESDVYVIENFSIIRPGRFSLVPEVAEEAPKPAPPAPKKKEEPKKEEEKEEPKVEEPEPKKGPTSRAERRKKKETEEASE